MEKVCGRGGYCAVDPGTPPPGSVWIMDGYCDGYTNHCGCWIPSMINP